MKKMKSLKKLIGVIMIGCMLLGLGVTTYAYNETGEGNTNFEKRTQRFGRESFRQRREIGPKHEDKKVQLNNILAELVKEGIISKEKSDSIVSFAEERAKAREKERAERQEARQEAREVGRSGKRKEIKDMVRGRKTGLVEELEEEGIITSEEADIIRDKTEAIKKEKRNEMLNENLGDLVEEGTITENDIDTIIEYMDAHMVEKRAEMEKVRGMTEEERKEYFEENRPERKDLLSEMVEDGVISEKKAEEIKKVLPKPHLPMQHGRGQLNKA